MPEPLKVLVADDHHLFREGVVKVVSSHSDFTLVAQAANGKDALTHLRTLRPDIALLDVEMPELDGIGVTRAAYKEALPVHIIILTMYKEAAYFNTAFDLGVRGYLLKDAAIGGDLLQALLAVAKGEYYISPPISHLLVERANRWKELSAKVPSLASLTPAGKKILRLLAGNITSKQIGERLGISTRGVENHRSHIARKLDLHGHNRLLQFAIEHKQEL